MRTRSGRDSDAPTPPPPPPPPKKKKTAARFRPPRNEPTTPSQLREQPAQLLQPMQPMQPMQQRRLCLLPIAVMILGGLFLLGWCGGVAFVADKDAAFAAVSAWMTRYGFLPPIVIHRLDDSM